jgi:hypothetical protein
MFEAEQFDPGSWADLFRQAGAKYVVLTAKHSEEFALWPTKYTRRNAMEMGPHRDLAGDLTKEVRSRGMNQTLKIPVRRAFSYPGLPSGLLQINHSLERTIPSP